MFDTISIQHEDDGTGLIEMAFILPIMLLILYGIFDFSIWIQRSMQLQEAANAGAAFAAMPGAQPSHAAVVVITNFNATNMLNGVTGFSASATDFYCCYPGGSHVVSATICPTGAPYHYVQVTATLPAASVFYPYKFIPLSESLSATATYRVETLP
jgi:Flp pilus assembly protein TadG